MKQHLAHLLTPRGNASQLWVANEHLSRRSAALLIGLVSSGLWIMLTRAALGLH
jgi:hypothetical protein